LTVKLYWQDAYRRTFGARVLSRRDLGGKPGVVLDCTCFYATSGGQPHDTGTLNGIPVVDVVEDGPEIVHVLAAPLADDAVSGEIDWARRFDHMQQHTGQHVLSQAFIQVAGAETVSFHLGDEAVTIDLAIPTLTEEQSAAAERLANEIVMASQPVVVSEHPAACLGALGLRKQPDIEGPLRVVAVADFDRCACGGTHVRHAGEIGPVHVSRWDSQRGNTRVEFLCGWRALRDYAARDALLRSLARDLSVGWAELPDRYARLEEQSHASHRQVEHLRKRLLDYELPRLAAQAEQRQGYRLLRAVLADYDAGNMRYIAQRLLLEPGMVVLLGVTEPTVQFCMGRSVDLPFDMGQILREAGQPLNARGGGKLQMAQGGGVAVDDLELLLQRAADLLATLAPAAFAAKTE
jgi:alanyl-tRNA synthetase